MLLLGVVQAQAFEAAGAGSYDLLQTEILTGSQASVTFSSLGDYAGTYQHLQIRYVARTDTGTDIEQLRFQFNADTGSNYSAHGLFGVNGAVGSGAETSQTSGQAGWMSRNASADVYAGGVVDILDPFKTTKNTTVRGLSGFYFGSGFQHMIALTSGAWYKTNSVTEIKLFGTTFNLPAECRFSLYGLRSA